MAEESDSGQPIPEHLASQMPPQTQKALQHAYRRQILRSLHGDARTVSAFELAESGLVPCSVSCASYHLHVLEGSGLVATARSSNGDTARQHFAATLDGEADIVLDVLRGTAQIDLQQFESPPS